MKIPELNGLLDQMERLGKIINTLGVSLMLAVFVSWYAGWISSPLQIAISDHERESKVIRVKLTEAMSIIAEQQRIQTRMFKIIGCSAIKEYDIRSKCLDDR